MTTTYNERECYKCGVALVVPRYDDSAYSYCSACAFSKLGMVYDNRTSTGGNNDR